MGSPPLNRACEADFFPSQVIENSRLGFFQFGVEVAVVVDHGLSNLGKEGFVEPDLRAKARRTSDDHARHVVTTSITRNDAICNEERRRTDVVADHAIRREVGKHFLFAVTRKRAQQFERASKEVGLVVRVHAL